MTSTALEKIISAGTATVTPTGLLLSIGDTETRGSREIPKKIDHFRPKDGQLSQYAAAATQFLAVYGHDAKELDDVYFLSNDIESVLEIRLMAWGESGVRLRGDTNYAALPNDEWEDAAYSFTDKITFYPLELKEVPNSMKPTWKGEPVRGELNGPDDPRIKKLQINVECTLSFLLPKVMGIGTVAKITTKSKRSMRNLHSSVHAQHTFLGSRLVGPPFRLSVRPAKNRRFDEKERRMIANHFFELVLTSALTVDEIYEVVKRRQEALGSAPLGEVEAQTFSKMLELPVASEHSQTREEPAAAGTTDDALLNRLARLEEVVGADPALTCLRGVFGVDSATELDQAAAEQYEKILERSLPPAEDGGEVEIVEDADFDDSIPWPGKAPE